MSSLAARIATPEVRTSAFYLTKFGPPGAIAAYFGIWLSDKGLSATEIGLVNAIPVALTLLLAITIGRIADRASDWRKVIIIGAFVSGLAPLGLLAADGFFTILAVWTVFALAQSATGPISDAAAVRMTRRRGTDFGRIRAMGTVGYMLSLPLTGQMVGAFGGALFVPVLAALSILRAGASLLLPRFRAPPEPSASLDIAEPLASRLSQLLRFWFVLPILGYAIVHGTHLMLHAFAAFVWKEAGIAPATIGWLLVLGAASEVLVMLSFNHAARRYGARHLIAIAAAVSALRWCAMAFNPPVTVLVGLQALHGITFGLSTLGVVHFIADWTAEDMAAEAQSFASVLHMAMSVASVAGFGLLFSIVGERAFLAAGAICAVALALVVVSVALRPVSRREVHR